MQDAKLCDIGTPIARTLTTHEPGVSNHHCNLVIVKMNKDKHPIFLGNYNGFGPSYAGAVYSKKGIAPTLNTMQGGGREPMILEDKIAIKQATKDGYIEMENGGVADLCYPESTTRHGRVQEQGRISPTITAENNEICRIEKVGQISNDGSQCGTVVSDKGLFPTLSVGTHGYSNPHVCTEYRIRKLTPKECYRLMGFSDEAFEKASSVCSNTQLYKQAGNSIVVDVLENIFKQLF